MVFKDMSVEENLALGAYPKRCRPARGRNLERVFALFPRLKERRAQMAGSLSGGEAQMLAMGRGMMSEPAILLIDEPTASLDAGNRDVVVELIAEARANGCAIVGIFHDEAVRERVATRYLDITEFRKAA